MYKIALFYDLLPEDIEVKYSNFISTQLMLGDIDIFKNFEELFLFDPSWINLETKLRLNNIFTKKRASLIAEEIEHFFVSEFYKFNTILYESHLRNKVVILSPLSDNMNQKLEKFNIYFFNPSKIDARLLDIKALEFASSILGVEIGKRVNLYLNYKRNNDINRLNEFVTIKNIKEFIS